MFHSLFNLTSAISFFFLTYFSRNFSLFYFFNSFPCWSPNRALQHIAFNIDGTINIKLHRTRVATLRIVSKQNLFSLSALIHFSRVFPVCCRLYSAAFFQCISLLCEFYSSCCYSMFRNRTISGNNSGQKRKEENEKEKKIKIKMTMKITNCGYYMRWMHPFVE